MKSFNYCAIYMVTSFLSVLMFTSCDGFKNSGQTDNEITVKGADGTEYSSYREACSKGDFDAARKYIEKMKEKKTSFESDNYDKKEEWYEAVVEAEKYVFDNELNALAAMNSEQSNIRIILLLNEITIDGEPRPEGTCIGKDCYVLFSYRDGADEAYSNYMRNSSKFNLQCDRIMDIAIACGNKNLAEQMLWMIRQDATYTYKPSASRPRDENYKDVYAHYTNDSKNAAQKKYQEAVNNGAFK